MMIDRGFWWILVWLVLQETAIGGRESPDFEFEHNYVSLTVTPDIEQYGTKQCHGKCCPTNLNDWVRVFGADPTHGRPLVIAKMALLNYPVKNTTSGWLETDLTVNTKTVQLLCHGGQFKRKCFKYWVVYVNGDTQWGENFNIVAVDFLQSTNIIDAAIHWNTKKIILSYK